MFYHRHGHDGDNLEEVMLRRKGEDEQMREVACIIICRRWTMFQESQVEAEGWRW